MSLDEQTAPIVKNRTILALQISGALLAMAGAWLSAGATNHQRSLGFDCYLAANLILVIYVARTRQWALLGMYLFFLVSSMRGIWNNGI